jgi:hypothetical protein
MDRSWTIYHVFPGIPARVDGSALTDLSRSAATDGNGVIDADAYLSGFGDGAEFAL